MRHTLDIPTADKVKATLFGLADLLAAPRKRPADRQAQAYARKPGGETTGRFDAARSPPRNPHDIHHALKGSQMIHDIPHHRQPLAKHFAALLSGHSPLVAALDYAYRLEREVVRLRAAVARFEAAEAETDDGLIQDLECRIAVLDSDVAARDHKLGWLARKYRTSEVYRLLTGSRSTGRQAIAAVNKRIDQELADYDGKIEAYR